MRFEGPYDVINGKIQEVFEDSKGYFKLSNTFGIYYDPEGEPNPNKMHAALGILVHEA